MIHVFTVKPWIRKLSQSHMVKHQKPLQSQILSSVCCQPQAADVLTTLADSGNHRTDLRNSDGWCCDSIRKYTLLWKFHSPFLQRRLTGLRETRSGSGVMFLYLELLSTYSWRVLHASVAFAFFPCIVHIWHGLWYVDLTYKETEINTTTNGKCHINSRCGQRNNSFKTYH